MPSTAFSLEVDSNARLTFRTDVHTSHPLLKDHGILGDRAQCFGTQIHEARQIVLGLDFGTSSVKVVIGDSALGKAFAVPFTEGSGIDAYLLPSCLYETGDKFSLVGGDTVYRDLKLSLLADLTDRKRRDNAAAFLALVIRHARGWLLGTHTAIYCNTKIVWKLVIGLPEGRHSDSRLYRAFKAIAYIAWLAANMEGGISQPHIQAARARHRAISMNPEQVQPDEDIDVEAVSELAAQIYGFAKSDQFDVKASNIFLMVDVGAGTVDSSLFHLKQARGGRWDFEFFTSIVEPHGVMNLHRYRIDWWHRALNAAQNEQAHRLLPALDELKFPTDRMVSLPESYSQYFEGISVSFPDPRESPDEVFFCKKVVRQVRGNTYWRTGNDGLLPTEALRGISAFYCGGGTRLGLYDRLRKELREFPGCTWLNAIPRTIQVPQNLEAPGLIKKDYDRLSVAYGLSFLEVGQIVRSMPQPKL